MVLSVVAATAAAGAGARSAATLLQLGDAGARNPFDSAMEPRKPHNTFHTMIAAQGSHTTAHRTASDCTSAQHPTDSQEQRGFASPASSPGECSSD